MIEIEEMAKDMYIAYAESSGNKNFQGNPMPTWEELPPAIRTHWCAAATRGFELFFAAAATATEEPQMVTIDRRGRNK